MSDTTMGKIIWTRDFNGTTIYIRLWKYSTGAVEYTVSMHSALDRDCIQVCFDSLALAKVFTYTLLQAKSVN